MLLRCSPHSSGPESESLQARLTFCAHSGQLLERSFAPLEFLEFTEPTDTLTVFLHGDRSLSKASALAEQQLAEVGLNPRKGTVRAEPRSGSKESGRVLQVNSGVHGGPSLVGRVRQRV